MSTVLDETRSHYTSGPFGANGHDVFAIHIPSGEGYTNTALETIEAVGQSGVRVAGEPQGGISGDATIEIAWWYSGHGKIRYRVKSFAQVVQQPTATVSIKTSAGFKRTSYSLLVRRGSHVVTIAQEPGFGFRDAQLIKVDKSAIFASVAIRNPPPQGTTGEISVQIDWAVAWGSISYELQVISHR